MFMMAKTIFMFTSIIFGASGINQITEGYLDKTQITLLFVLCFLCCMGYQIIAELKVIHEIAQNER